MTAGKNPIQRWRFHWRWVVALTLAYFAVLGAAIWATYFFDLKLTESSGFFHFPTLWALQLTALYYAIPIVIAFAGGVLMRPFWHHFWAIVIAIFAIHGVYSAVAFGLRSAYVSEWTADLAATRDADWRVESMDHDFVDKNGDGLFEDIRLMAQLDPGSLPPAGYEATALLSEHTRPLLPQVPEKFMVTGARRTSIEIVFEFGAARLTDMTKEAETDVAVMLNRRKEVNREGTVRLALCRWAAFCPTNIGGYDPVIVTEWIELGSQENVHRFTFPRDKIQRPQVIFRDYLGDRGRDLDGDGLFDELVISMALDSIYEGPIYFQAFIDHASLSGARKLLPTFESKLEKGSVNFEYVIDGEQLRRLGGKGPYTLKTFIMMNNSPYCPQVQCPHKNKPLFTVYLSPYTTGSYRAEQFE